MTRPVGRPTVFTPELGQAICDAISDTQRGLKFICRNNDAFPDRLTVLRWLREKEEFRNHYAQAKAYQADYMAEEIIDVSYDDKEDYKVICDKDGRERTVLVAEAINRSRLKVDSLKHISAQLEPKKWGNKQEISSSNADGQAFILKVLDQTGQKS